MDHRVRLGLSIERFELFEGMKDQALIERLVTDPLMKSVWREVGSRPRCVAFLDCAFAAARFPQILHTPRESEMLKRPWISAAQLCWWTKENDSSAKMDPSLADALVRVADYFDQQARRYPGDKSPLTIQRRSRARGDERTRGYVRVLAAETRRLFGSFLYGTVATTTGVALGVRRPTLQSVRNWCADLPRQ